jgi:signal transduction histidine kinase
MRGQLRDNQTTILKIIPQILNMDLSSEKTFATVLNAFNDVYEADLGIVTYIGSIGLEIKHLKSFDNEEYNVSQSKETGLQTRSFIKHKQPAIFSVNKNSNSILTELGMSFESNYSFMALPLIIKSALFGIIIILKKQKDFYSQEDLLTANALAGVCSYSVKDSELAEVFKIQLKSLKENILEKMHANEIIKEQNQKIKESDRLKSEFIANMSHELRTPLNAIIGFSEAMQLKLFGDLTPKQEEYINDIHSSGIHLLGMINDLLDISKIEANEMNLYKNNFNVYRAVNEVNNIIKALANKKNIEITIECKDENIEIYADEQKFHQIMYNLLSNAIKFTDEGGKVEAGISTKKGNLVVYVRDNGIGIEEKYHGKIFAKFQQVDSSYTRKQGSTGLGLAITKELIELHNGKIFIDSQINKGTTFTFELPLNEK